MPHTCTVHDQTSINALIRGLTKEIKKGAFVNVAYSTKGMKAEDFDLASLPAKALKAIWIRQVACLNFNKSEVSDAEYEGMNRWLKIACYSATKQEYLVRAIVHPDTGETKLETTSAAHWSTGEMTHFLDWMQAHYAEDGLILEAKGEYKELSERQNR